MYSVLLMMAGSSTRMNLKTNKVFLKLGNEYVFKHALKRFLEENIKPILVVSESDYDFVKNECKDIKIVKGGKTRQESVLNGLKEVDTKYVLIHDASRVFITNKTIKEAINALKEGVCVLAYDEVVDTIKELNNNKLKTLNRSSLIRALTPQGGPTEVLKDCHVKALAEGFEATDDISLVERYSKIEIRLIKSDSLNFKITKNEDYLIAKALVEGNMILV